MTLVSPHKPQAASLFETGGRGRTMALGWVRWPPSRRLTREGYLH